METDEQDSPGAREIVDFVSSITDSARLRIEENLPHGFVRLKVAEAERRQAQHDIRSVEDIVTELVRNSRDAGATRILVGFQKEKGRYRKIAVLDDGRGIPEEMHGVVFEPRVTSKREDFEEDRYGVHGRGMALFSIRSRVPDTRIVSSGPGAGTAIALTVDTGLVPERTDQATLPSIEVSGEGLRVGPGPHNVARVLLEMSVDHPGISFYLGSFSEVLATIHDMGPASAGIGTEAVWSGVAASRDARELAEFSAAALGIPVSERNAYRVVGGEVRPLEPIRAEAGLADTGEAAADTTAETHSRAKARARHRNPLARLEKSDLEEIGSESAAVAGRVLGRYFLATSGEPRVRWGRGKLTVTLHVVTDEGEGE